MEQFESFENEVKTLKTDIKMRIESVFNQLQNPTQHFLTSWCYLSGGSISSIYHNEEVKDYDLWCIDSTNIESLTEHLNSIDCSELDNVNDYSNLSSFVNGKVTTDNAITLQNGIQFIKIANYEKCRASFDFIHCMPYYDLKNQKLVISYNQWKSIREKRLVMNPAVMAKLTQPINHTEPRFKKYKERGWSWQ